MPPLDARKATDEIRVGFGRPPAAAWGMALCRGLRRNSWQAVAEAVPGRERRVGARIASAAPMCALALLAQGCSVLDVGYCDEYEIGHGVVPKTMQSKAAKVQCDDGYVFRGPKIVCYKENVHYVFNKEHQWEQNATWTFRTSAGRRLHGHAGFGGGGGGGGAAPAAAGGDGLEGQHLHCEREDSEDDAEGGAEHEHIEDELQESFQLEGPGSEGDQSAEEAPGEELPEAASTAELPAFVAPPPFGDTAAGPESGPALLKAPGATPLETDWRSDPRWSSAGGASGAMTFSAGNGPYSAVAPQVGGSTPSGGGSPSPSASDDGGASSRSAPEQRQGHPLLGAGLVLASLPLMGSVFAAVRASCRRKCARGFPHDRPQYGDCPPQDEEMDSLRSMYIEDFGVTSREYCPSTRVTQITL